MGDKKQRRAVESGLIVGTCRLCGVKTRAADLADLLASVEPPAPTFIYKWRCAHCATIVSTDGFPPNWIFTYDHKHLWEPLALLVAPPLEPTPTEPQANLRKELCVYLDTVTVTSDTIGDIRRGLFVPWSSPWNGWVRDETAAREKTPTEPQA